MNRNELDEMQMQKRNKIGNQAFMLLFYLLMIDIGLYGFGFRWLDYPINVYLIMLACMSYYLTSIIWNNAYIGPKAGNKTGGKTIVLTGAVAVVSAAAAMFLSKSGLIKTTTSQENVNGTMVLLIFSTLSIVITVIVSLITKRQNRNIDE